VTFVELKARFLRKPEPQSDFDVRHDPRMTPLPDRWALVRLGIRSKIEMLRWMIQTIAPLGVLIAILPASGRVLAATVGIALVAVSTFFPPAILGLDAARPTAKAMISIAFGAILVGGNALACSFAFALVARQFGVVPPWLLLPGLAGFAIYPILTCGFDSPIRKLFYWPSDGWKMIADSLNVDEPCDEPKSR
jgi:hypothetical protein